MSQSPKELTPYVSVRHFFGAELRRWREQRDLSQDRLGREVNFDGSLIGKVEKAERMPSRALAQACDRVLETGGSLARLWPLVDQERQRAEVSKTANEVAPGPYAGGWPSAERVGPDTLVLPVLTSNGKIVFMPIDRRTLLCAGAVIALPFDASDVEWPRLARAIQAPERVDTHIVGYLQRVLDEHGTADKLHGPRHLIDVVTAQMRFIDYLRGGARGEVRNELLTVGARYAEFAGWLHQDAGDTQAATYWTDRAMEWAQEAGNHVLVSYVLMRKSHQARDQRDGERVIGLAQVAQRVAGPLPPRIRAMAAEEEAQGHALADDEVACHRKFDEALELVASSHRDGIPGPGQGRWCTEVYIELQRANGWMELGHPLRAIGPYEYELARLPAVQQRDRGVYLARLGRAYVANRDPEQATAVGQKALVIGRETGSARIFTELHRLDAGLVHWPDLPAVAQFHEALTHPN
ncbi:MAG: helix-turn-helix domain-containing protein [Egibacteraceae bacterium]